MWLFIAFCLIILVQLFYYLFFFARLATYQSKDKHNRQEYPVSVVICAKDEAANLAKNLLGVLVQEYQTTHEVIVVNDNSVDESKYVLEEYQKPFKSLNILALTQEAKGIPGKKFPLSMGIKAAKYEVLLLTDADCTPASEYWLQKMQEGYNTDIDVVLGYGAYAKKNTFLNKLIRFETFFTAQQYLSFALAGIPYMGVGRNLSYRREVFIRNKGFSSINHIPSGDDDLFIHKVANKTNTAIVIDKDAHTISEPKKSWAEWRYQKQRHYSTGRYYKPKVKLLLGLFSLSNFLVYPLLIGALATYTWWIVLIPYILRMIILASVWRKNMDKLNEQDLWSSFILWDIWMFVYYIIFAPFLIKKPSKHWNK